MNIKVPMINLARQYEELKGELTSRFRALLDSGQFILGDDVAEFEKEIGQYLAVRHAITVTSGTDALALALRACGIGPGDRVLTSPFTFFATVSGIINVGAEPQFADIDPATFNLDPSSVQRALEQDTGKRIKAIVPIHLFGQAADMEALGRLAKARGIPLIEDAAQAVGTQIRGKRVGGIGDVGCFSFFPTKNLGAIGDAGLVVTNDDGIADTLRLMRNHGSRQRYHHDIIGGNYRMDTVQALALRVFLPHLEKWNAERNRVAAIYDEALSKDSRFKIPARTQNGNHLFHQYTIRVEASRRDSLIAQLSSRGIGSSVYYPIPCHLQPALGKLKYQAGAFPNAESAAREVLSIPIHPVLTSDEQNQVIDAILRWDP